MRFLLKSGVVVMLLVGAASFAQAGDGARYTFGGSGEQEVFVLDTESGRVWRYDRIDDAWYLYDLEALVRTPRGESRGRNLSDRDRSDGDLPQEDLGRDD